MNAVLLPRPPYTLLIVGNGLTLDLCYGHAAEQLGSWNTSRPLGWPVMTPDQPNVRLRDRLPAFDAAVRDLQTRSPAPSDFEIIDLIAHAYHATPDDYTTMQAYVEARHFLALAYSTFQVKVDHVDLAGWPWVRYFQSLGRDLIGAFSFNYDLVLERALEVAGAPYARLGLAEEEGGGIKARIVKPHGSIDFEIHDNAIQMPVGYPIPNLFDQINSPVRRIPRDDLLRARKNPELIAPMQATTARHYQWVAPGFDGFVRQGARLVGTCVLAGISYWEVDRPEIDEVLDSLLPGTDVVVANPSPPPDLMAALRARGFDPVDRDGPPF